MNMEWAGFTLTLLVNQKHIIKSEKICTNLCDLCEMFPIFMVDKEQDLKL